jgi:hypothetical protein
MHIRITSILKASLALLAAVSRTAAAPEGWCEAAQRRSESVPHAVPTLRIRLR